jgi:hypothetical protein
VGIDKIRLTSALRETICHDVEMFLRVICVNGLKGRFALFASGF